MRLSLGHHLVEIEKDGYVNQIINRNFKRGFTSRINISLKEAPRPVAIDETGQFMTLQAGTNDLYYLGNNGGAIYKTNVGLNDTGEVKLEGRAITNSNLGGIDDIVWSPKKDLALFKKSDGIYLFDFKKYDFINQTENPWGSDIGDIAWSPDNSKIAYSYAPPAGEKSLIFANLDNSKPERVLNLKELNIENPLLRWSPDSEWLLIIAQNNSKIKTLYLFNAYSRQIEELIKAAGDVDGTFSPDGGTILYSSEDDDGAPILSTITLDKTVNIDLNLSATIKNIYWEKDNINSIVAGAFSERKQTNSIFNFDLKINQPDKYSIDLPEGEEIRSVATAGGGNIVIYETDEGAYAIKID
jgi:dipeptidyl aminopeptidase/acylaminoacyl peptidase